MGTGVMWEGEPITYRRPAGFGLIIRDLHYRFDQTGRIEAVSGLNQKVLELLIREIFKDRDPDKVLAAYVSTAGLRQARAKTRKTVKTPETKVSERGKQ